MTSHGNMANIPEESKVKYTFLGKSGLKVSNICLGTLTFGETPVSYKWIDLGLRAAFELK